ncbi:phosphate ABC transporter permease PstA [Methanospirillum hungatei]|uniref:phosphate ABC transporter permease PstA n=1 Tax=Methanospirillum hungatei TaxID=2203 RepID=UPI0026EBF016|nr:phosphate ABC transporter permease PstA [Methanospirillum hungatei]MCA1917348.1 phosphate ABC transporter permease PstA [Methanospirillum hungatei]
MTIGQQNPLKFRQKRRPLEITMHTVWFICAISSIIGIFFILIFLLYDAAPAFLDIGLIPFLTGERWDPTSIIPKYGLVPLIVGTLLVTIGAMIFAVPFGIACAIFIAELASPRMRNILKPAVELLAGIPSVVYGFFGLVILVKFLQDLLSVPSGESVLAGSILLGIMSLPTIISVSEDAISSVPRYLKEGSLALGATHWQTISQVIVPAALSGITAAVILGIGRAVGETMAVIMVTGNAAIIPSPIWNILSPVRTLTGTLGIEMGEVAVGSLHYHALFGVAVVLLLITLIINLAALTVMKRLKSSQTGGCSRTGVFSCRMITDRLSGIMPYLPPGLTALLGLFLLLIGLWQGAAGMLILYLIVRLVDRYCIRQTVQKIWFSLVTIMMGIVTLILIFILYDIFSNGLPYVTIDFLTESPRNLGRGGGIFPAIIGTFYLVIGSILIALPLGIGAAIYLVEYTKENILTRFIRTATDLLNGTPSIVFGLFGFTFLVLFLGFGISLLAGMITLALMVLPTVIRTTEEALKSVPDSLREGSYALGATRWQTVRRVVLPPSVPGIITGAILSIGRAAGETAPIMFTAVVFMQRRLPDSFFDPVMALPYHLFILATNVPGARNNQYATAVVLLFLVIMIYGGAIVIRNHYDKKIRW